MAIDFTKASFKDFENVPGADAWVRADLFNDYLKYLAHKGHLNYRLVSTTGCSPEMEIIVNKKENPRSYVSFVSNDYLGFLFSANSTPAAMGILRAIDLLDEEPHWKDKLWDNINYFKSGLTNLGLDIGTTESAIIPVKIGDAAITGEAGRLLLKAGIYTNPIIYPAVSKKNARIRMSVMATHTRDQLDKALNAFEYADQKLHISKNIGSNL